MMDTVIVIAIAASAFIATNLDNLVLLVGLLGRYSDRRYEVVFAYLAAALIIGALSFYIGKLANNFPVNYIGLLGVFPVTIGIFEVVRLFRNKGVVRDPTAAGIGSTAVAATLLTQLSNGADTIVTFSVLFADANELADNLVALAFIGMALVFGLVACGVLKYNWLSRPIQLYGHYITPLILITVGLFVLSNTALDLMPGT